jgi:hypothetical protein
MAETTGLDILASHIAQELEEREFCLVFETELERCWPNEKFEDAERQQEIEAFADAHGWNAFILTLDSGLRAIFRK